MTTDINGVRVDDQAPRVPVGHPTAPARQQPAWSDPELAGLVRTELTGRPALVGRPAVLLLRSRLAEVAHGRGLVLQAGDCVEDLGQSSPAAVRDRVDLINSLADALAATSGRPVLRVGRIAGQYAKPRSANWERHGDTLVPVFRGHMINGFPPTLAARRHDADRLLACYDAAAIAGAVIRRHATRRPDTELWHSHEALVLDYELPLLRGAPGNRWLSSTHWPWIGDRTRQPDGAHVKLLSSVVNPVACKVGPSMSVPELLRVCAALDPARLPGRLTLIARLGRDRVVATLPDLVRAVATAGHPVVWLCDPMHGNTVSSAGGRKTRLLVDIMAEVRQFHATVPAAGGTAGGLHLEVTPDDVTECVDWDVTLSTLDARYTSLCDPRLNPGQAHDVVAAWPR